jgi:hypothetical protein
MPRQSQVALHPRRAEIEIGLAMGMQVKALAKKYGFDVQVLYRYKKDMPASRKAAILAAHTSPGVDLDKLRIVESEGLLAHLIAQRGRCHEAIDLAIEYGDLKAWHLFEGDITRNLELTGKLLGELGVGTTVNTILLAGHPEYLQLRHALMSALIKYPAAKKAVLTALKSVETEQPAIEGESVSIN